MADFYFGASTSDWETLYSPIGGGSNDPTIMNITSEFTFTVPVGGIIITELGRGMDSAPGQAGGTFNIGVYDITSGTASAPLLGQATVNVRSDGAGYVWHSVTGLSIPITAGKLIAVAATPPTVLCWHTRNAEGQLYNAPGNSETTLSSTWSGIGTGRAIPLRAGYSLASPPATLYDINTNNTVKIGSTGNTISTSGLGTLTSLTIGGVAATGLSAPSGDGTFTMPAFSDGVVTSLLGTVAAVAGDGTDTANRSVALQAPNAWSYVTLTGTLNTSTTGILYNFSPAAVPGDQIVFETGNVIVDAQGNIDTDTNTSLWHIQASTGIARTVAVTVEGGVSGLTVSITGVAGTGAVGTVTPNLGSTGLTVAITGVAGTGTVGTVVPSLGSGADITVAISGVAGTGTVGAVTPVLGATTLTVGITGVSGTGTVGTVTTTLTDYIVRVSTDLPKFVATVAKSIRRSFKKSFRKK